MLNKMKSGKFFSCTFTKKDGSEGVFLGRSGVRRHLKGGEKGYDAESMGYITAYDVRKKGYRSIAFPNIRTFNGKKV